MEQVPIFHVEFEPHIHMVIQDKLREYAGRDDLSGWISGQAVSYVEALLEEKAALMKENATLHAALEKHKKEDQ